jgi:hypothetical protein
MGPPASGKTLCMAQVVRAAAEAVKKFAEAQCQGSFAEDSQETPGGVASSSAPLMPIFVRAAELSSLLRRHKMDSRFDSLEELVKHFVCEKEWSPMPQEDARPGQYAADPSLSGKGSNAVATLLLDLFEINGVILLINGLDEAAGERNQIESWIDRSTKAHAPLRLMVSTREYVFETSRECGRLRQFEAVKIRGLDEKRRNQLIKKRLAESPDMAEGFRTELQAMAKQNPELVTSPFLLSLMIEVYKKKESLSSQRVDLYKEQIEGVVSRCLATRIENKLKYHVSTRTAIFLDGPRKGESAPTLGKSASNDKAATQYLETLAFVCQLRLATRDFKLSECASHVQELWQDSEDALSEAQQVLFTSPIVGLLADVGHESHRFSHLTLQEYLAARCAVRLYGRDVQELLDHLRQGDALFSRWKREVLQFTACMLPEDTFSQFCRVLLEMEDCTGAHCELVKDFSKERDLSNAVQQMMSEQMQKNRGIDLLLAGLCHPCSEMRLQVVSEMKRFRSPPDPFADGSVVSKLKVIAEDADCVWHKRAAAMLSIAHIAQMKPCSRTDRTATIGWMLKMLQSESNVLENVHFALVSALGTMLKEGGDSAADDGIMLQLEDEIILTQLDLRKRVVAHALSDLRIYSSGLVDWLEAGDPLGARLRPVSPVFNVFLDAMTCVAFQTEQSRDNWSSYDVNKDFERSHEFGLAQVIGAYLHRGEVSSPVLDSFHQALRAPDPAGPLAYLKQLQLAALAPALKPVVLPSLGAIYCYWRIERELLHPFYSQQLGVKGKCWKTFSREWTAKSGCGCGSVARRCGITAATPAASCR